VGSTVIGQLLSRYGLDSPSGTPSAVTDWVTNSGASKHTTSDVNNLTFVRPPTSTDPSSIIIGNRLALSVTSVRDSTLFGPFYLNNVLFTPDII
jgi:hypothetical protein